MALKLRIDKIEDVPEALRSLYVAKDGAFVLDAETDPEVAKLDEFRRNNKTLHGELERWKALGLTPEQAAEKIKADRKKAEEDEKGKLSAEQLEAKYKKQFEEAQAAAKADREALQSKLDRHEIMAPLRKALVEAGAIASEVDDLLEMPSVKSRYGRSADGKISFKDADGATIVDGMTPQKFAEQMRKERPRWFSPVGATGSDSKPSATVTKDGVKQIDVNDQNAINASLEDIASGKAVVVSGAN